MSHSLDRFLVAVDAAPLRLTGRVLRLLVEESQWVHDLAWGTTRGPVVTERALSPHGKGR